MTKLLTMGQKQIVKNILGNVKGDSNFLKTVITGDESWANGYDPEIKKTILILETSIIPVAKRKTWQIHSNEVMLIFFFDSFGLVHHSSTRHKVKLLQWSPLPLS
ncbi:hypothetical protein NPIL_654141 [Nephila pilipes]|uniref:Uncharacterized protein n=1 Tax=Nephila pilipes TaxID=299642 RepID=A0A8X6NEK6_NEPPI|nr:hypothetical protein NPIL_654141 [Nephila pilipes]